MEFDEDLLSERYDQAFPHDPGEPDEAEQNVPLMRAPRRRRSIRERLVFYLANALLMPGIALSYQIVGAEGLRSQIPIFATKLYKLPIPGISVLGSYESWDRIDLSQPVSLIAFCATTYIWLRIFHELYGLGDLKEQRHSNPVLFYALCTIAVLIVLGDSAVFYLGLAAQSNGWGGANSALVPIAATVFWMTGIALVGAWHADYYAGRRA